MVRSNDGAGALDQDLCAELAGLEALLCAEDPELSSRCDQQRAETIAHMEAAGLGWLLLGSR